MDPSYEEMSSQLRKRALGLLLARLEDGVLPWGSFTIVTDQIGVARSTISRLWRQARRAHEQSLIITPEIASRNNSRVNCCKYSHTEFCQGLKEIPRCRRKTYRSTVKAMGVALSTVQQMLLHQDVCRPHIFPQAYIDGREQDVKDGVGSIICGQEQHKQVQEHGGSHSHR